MVKRIKRISILMAEDGTTNSWGVTCKEYLPEVSNSELSMSYISTRSINGLASLISCGHLGRFTSFCMS